MLFFGLQVLLLSQVELSNQPVNFMALVVNSVKALGFESLSVHLNGFVLVLQVHELVFQSSIIPLTVFHVGDVVLKFSYKKLLVLAESSWSGVPLERLKLDLTERHSAALVVRLLIHAVPGLELVLPRLALGEGLLMWRSRLECSSIRTDRPHGVFLFVIVAAHGSGGW